MAILIDASLVQYFANAVPIPPLKQMKSGISSSKIECGRDFALIFKISNNSPVCLTPQTAQKLVERGWGTWAEITIKALAEGEKTGIISGHLHITGGTPQIYPGSNPNVNFKVEVYASDGVTLVGRTFSNTNETYSIQLPVGNYTIYKFGVLDPANTVESQKRSLVQVFVGQTTIFNIAF